jgi:hypothetical protein
MLIKLMFNLLILKVMSKQLSIIKLQGTIDDITFYQMYGRYFAKKATSLNKNKILNSPNFLRTRENCHEFGGCGTAVKSLRGGFAEIIKSMADSLATGRLVKIFKQINILADGIRGERPINLSEHKEMLQGFEFNAKSHFSTIFVAPYSIVDTPDRTSTTVTIAPFNAANYVKAPQGATHFRLISSLAVISDFQYNNISKKYYPEDPDNDQKNNTVISDYFSVNDDIPAPVILTATLPGAPVLPANVTVINALGIEFYQQINLDYYLFAQDNCMMIVKTF